MNNFIGLLVIIGIVIFGTYQNLKPKWMKAESDKNNLQKALNEQKNLNEKLARDLDVEKKKNEKI